ncbi:MAG: hypothetical protein BWZ02_02807 [Lentisphaerae bacterium ADurb.BinA184]|nr:MAG: hypothetical protein BWZ02_02807 [Lentisphaerae bacterium ADurb.BinA184]
MAVQRPRVEGGLSPEEGGRAQDSPVEHDGLPDAGRLRPVDPEPQRGVGPVAPFPRAGAVEDPAVAIQAEAAAGRHRPEATDERHLPRRAVPFHQMEDSVEARHRIQPVGDLGQAAAIHQLGVLVKMADETARGPAEHHAGVGFEIRREPLDRAVPGMAEPALPEALRTLAGTAPRPARVRRLPGDELVHRPVARRVDGAVGAQFDPLRLAISDRGRGAAGDVNQHHLPLGDRGDPASVCARRETGGGHFERCGGGACGGGDRQRQELSADEEDDGVAGQRDLIPVTVRAGGDGVLRQQPSVGCIAVQGGIACPVPQRAMAVEHHPDPAGGLRVEPHEMGALDAAVAEHALADQRLRGSRRRQPHAGNDPRQPAGPPAAASGRRDETRL